MALDPEDEALGLDYPERLQSLQRLWLEMEERNPNQNIHRLNPDGSRLGAGNGIAPPGQGVLVRIFRIRRAASGSGNWRTGRSPRGMM